MKAHVFCLQPPEYLLMLSYIRNITKEGSFVKNALVTTSWNGAVIVTQILLSPIITRLYGPSEYGVFAIFNSIVMNLALVGSLRYCEAIVIAANEEERNNLIALNLLLATSLALLSFVALIFFSDEIASFLDVSGSAEILFLIPFSFFMAFFLELLININVRRRKFSRNGLAGFVLQTTSRLSNIAYAVVVAGRYTGLIIGDFVGKIACLFSLTLFQGKKDQPERTWFEGVTRSSVKAVAIKYKSFALYYLPSQALVSLSANIPLYFFQWLYGSPMVGAFAFAASLLELFNRLIPYSLSPVLLQKASDLKNISHDLLCDRIYKLFLVMLGGGTFIYAGFALLGRVVFPFVFGSSWQLTGIFAGILAFSFTFTFVATTLSEVYNVLQRQRFLLANTVFTILLKGVAIVVIVFFKIDAEYGLLAYSIFSALGGLSLVLGVFVILRYKVLQVFGLLMVSLIVLAGAFFLGGLLF